ncbi:hypothetical protein ES703_120218 [subsurface metagenome]
MVAAEPGIGQRCQQQDDEARHQHLPRRAARGEEGDEGRERHRQVIGVALLEAERTGFYFEHELEKPGAGERCRGNERDQQRGESCGIGGDALA